jgi:hypothetical protein
MSEEQDYWFASLKSHFADLKQVDSAIYAATVDTAEVFGWGNFAKKPEQPTHAAVEGGEGERLDEHGEPLPSNCTGEGCSKCSGEYCERHFDKPCDCDVIDRHTPEDEDDFDISEEDLDATAEQSRPPQSWFDEKWELPLPTHAVDGEQQTNLL